MSTLADPRPSEIVLGVVRGISHGLFRKPEPFVAELRALGAKLVRIFLYWSQIEPERGRYQLELVDAFLAQLLGSEQVWITVCSSSPWATRQATSFLPPSPAKDPETYRAFVSRLVRHCAGRVRYWQCDNEPSNVGLTWAGTAAEYVDQLRIMYRAVKQADARAQVVLGGAPYALPASAPESPERQFFDLVLREGRDAFDLFDLHLYADAEAIPRDIESVRRMMRAHGYERPVLIGEYGAPTPEQFTDAQATLFAAMSAAMAGAPPALELDPQAEAKPPAAEAATATATAAQTPERAAIAALYQRMATLPPTLQMFMAGCPQALEEKHERILCREVVMRNLQALSAGVRITACWKLAPEISGYEDPLSIMELFYGKLLLMGFEGSQLRRHAAADTFALLSQRLHGAEEVARLEVPHQPRVRLFDVRRRDQGPLLVAWRQGDPFTGEDEPPIAFTWEWPRPRVRVVDALGRHVPADVDVNVGQLSLPLSITPLFIDAD